MTGERLEQIYSKYGGKAIYPPLFLFFFFLHFLSSAGMSLPATDPNELSVIAVGEWFIGNNWSGVMCSVDYYYGFLQGLLYAPALLIFGSPQAQYTAMLAVNALLISLVPPLAFSCSKKLGVAKVWKQLLIAFVTGAYCCYFAHAKFVWSETVTIVFPWLMLWLLLRAGEAKNKLTRHLFAVLLGACCALSLGAHTRLISAVLAVIAALTAQKIFYKKSSVPVLPFLLLFAVSGVPVLILSVLIQQDLWLETQPSLLANTVEYFIAQIGSGFSAENGIARFFITLFGQLYYFITATWGAGAVAICLFGVVLTRCIREKKAGMEQSYDAGTAGFAFFTFFGVVFTALFGVFYRFGSDGFTVYQDTTLFGRFLDGVIPFALMFVLVILFTRSIELKKLLAATVILALVYIAFFSATLPVILECGATRIAPILALYPLQIGTDSSALLSFESLLLTASMTFCVMALFIVIVSCTKKLRSPLISVILLGLTVYSVIFIQNEYLPLCRQEAQRKNSAVTELSESVYNQSGAPTLTAFNLSRHEALMLQFLNQYVTVRITYDIESIPENCYLAVKSDEDVSALVNGRSPFLLVAENGGLRLYAYGERAIAYMQSQNIGESEDESSALLPEKTSPSQTSAPEPTPDTSTTERTPKVSTRTTPAVITVPAEALGTDDEWAAIE